jgi:polyphenol oxidase
MPGEANPVPGQTALAAPDDPALPAPFGWEEGHVAVDLPGARALFTTRRGGCSGGPYASLNLGFFTDDEPSRVARNRLRVANRIDIAVDRFAFARQVHGAEVVRVRSAPDLDWPGLPGARPLPEGDGQATDQLGVATLVLVADCVPIAMAGEGAVAMLHGGWRGLAGGVAAEGVRALRELGVEGPLSAAIGPAAGACCYEVGEEVHAHFTAHGSAARRGRNLDLAAIARRELEAAGVGEVHLCGLCTMCPGSEALFFSHRREAGVTGRQAGIAWRRA